MIVQLIVNISVYALVTIMFVSSSMVQFIVNIIIIMFVVRMFAGAYCHVQPTSTVTDYTTTV